MIFLLKIEEVLNESEDINPALAAIKDDEDNDASLMTPENLNSLANDARLFQVYEGTLKGYNARKVRTLCRDLMNKAKKDIVYYKMVSGIMSTYHIFY